MKESKKMSSTTIHNPVLLKEIIENLDLANKKVILDGTFGGGGHAREILQAYTQIKIIAIDQDKKVFIRFEKNFKDLVSRVSFHNLNFRNLEKALEKEHLKKVDGIILDLGISSDQLENSKRGFSFQKNEPLLMTLKENPNKKDVTAEEIVNKWSEESLADIIYGYGEERFARRIAREIIEARKVKKIETTEDLVQIVDRAIPKKFKNKKIHFATKTFQALRIAVNDELRSLEEGLKKGFDFLSKDGVMVVISFHSLEDRIVKRFFSAKGGSASGGKENRVAEIITKKPIIASEKEKKENPRSRSAKLRIIKKII